MTITETAPLVDVPDGVEYVDPEVQELARGIAADIRSRGHYQPTRVGSARGYCIVTSPTWNEPSGEGVEGWRLLWRFASLLTGVDIARSADLEPVFNFNDNTPTADVLAALDRIGAGLVAS